MTVGPIFDEVTITTSPNVFEQFDRAMKKAFNPQLYSIVPPWVLQDEMDRRKHKAAQENCLHGVRLFPITWRING